MVKDPIHIISLGAGVQSSTMALMAAHGEITPMPIAAVFADTQAEPKSVYTWLDWLEKQLPFPVYRITIGSLKQNILDGMNGKGRMWSRPPFFTGGSGMLRRQCTGDFKIDPIRKKIREIIGLKPKQRAPQEIACVQWIGISLDEATRMKDSRHPFIQHYYPLVDMSLTRNNCVSWLQQHYGKVAPKSACTFCPYHSDVVWKRLKEKEPEAFAEAIEVDEAIRLGIPGPKRKEGPNGYWYVHPSLKPLREVDFSTEEERGQLNMFENDCSGHCGV